MRQFLKKKGEINRPQELFLTLSLIAGLIMILMIPPLKAPDEINHFAKAEAITEFQVIPRSNNKLKVIKEHKNMKTWNEFGFVLNGNIKSLSDISDESSDNFPFKEMLHLSKHTKKFVATQGISNYFILSFFPQAVGISIAKILFLPFFLQYYFARIFNLLFYVLIVFIAIKIFPFSKWIISIIALNPMAIFLASSTSGDALINAFSFLFISYIFFLLGKNTTIKNMDMMKSGLLLCCLVLMKPNNIVFGMLYFLFPNKQLRVRLKVLWGGTILFMSLIMYKIWNSYMISQELIYRDFADPNRQMKLFIMNPFIFIKNFFLHFIIGSNSTEIIQSYAGNFGQLNIPISIFWVFLYILTVLIGAVGFPSTYTLNWQSKVEIAVINFAYILLTFFALYLIWNPVESSVDILGVQGRYFIAPSLLTAILFVSHEKQFLLSEKRVVNIIYINMILIYVVTLFAIFHAYFC